MPKSLEPVCRISLRSALRVRDAASCSHPVDLAGADRLNGAEAVAVKEFAFEKISHCGETYVRVRSHVQAAAARNTSGPIWSKKMNGPTIRLLAEGSARLTLKPPTRSRIRVTIIVSTKGGVPLDCFSARLCRP